jgi:chaperonin GroEL
MSPKQLAFHDDARLRIRRGIDALAEAVKVTLGPRGRTVILEREFGPPQIVNSGVLVAKSVELEDRFENIGAQLLREVAVRTSDMAGDGTTTATVLGHMMIQEGLRYLAGGMNPMDLKRGIDKGIQWVVEELKRMAQPCATNQDIAHVASISANNDPSIGELLAQAIEKVGREGAISIEDGSGLVSVLEVVEGLQFDRGFLSPYFINRADRQAVVLEDAWVLMCEYKLASLNELLPLLEEVVKSGQPLLVVAEDLDTEVLAALVINTMRGALKLCAVKTPGFGEARKQLLADMAVLLGGSVLSELTGKSVSKVSLTELGRVKRIEVTKDNTTLIGGAGDPKAIEERVAALRRERETCTSEYDRGKLDERIAKLAGGVALIKVGAATETELKERKIRVEDALHATRAAVEEGIVPGGGVALLRARQVLRDRQGDTLDESSGIQLVARALEEPLRRIVGNAGVEPSVVLNHVDASRDVAFGYNAARNVYGDLMKAGVIDPVKVTRLALQNAASIASLVLMTDCVIVSKPNPSESPSPAGLGMESL